MEKWALVTGAAGGIGLEFARLLGADDFNLIMIDLDGQSLKELKEEIQMQHRNKVEILPFDLSDKNAAVHIFDIVQKMGVKLTVLINNAGFGMFGMFSSTSWEREEKMINLHIYTPTQLVKLFLPGMIERNSGRILNVSSLAAFHPGPLMCMYYSTKAYLLSFTASVATELKETGVSMTALCPGITKTGFQKTVGSGTPKINWNMADAASVASFGYRAMNHGRLLAVPGFFNNVILFIRRFLPYSVVASAVGNIQRRNRPSQHNLCPEN